MSVEITRDQTITSLQDGTSKTTVKRVADDVLYVTMTNRLTFALCKATLAEIDASLAKRPCHVFVDPENAHTYDPRCVPS